MKDFLTRTHGRGRMDWTDWLSYAYLALGLFTMFAPVLWLVMSSFKSEAAISQFPPTFLPYTQKSVQVAGQLTPLPLFMTRDDKGGQSVSQPLFFLEAPCPDLALSPAFWSVLSRRNASTIAVKPMPDDMSVLLEPIS